MYWVLFFSFVLTSLSVSRLVQNIRLAEDSSAVGVLSKDWDLDIEEQFRDDLRAASGIGKRRKKVWLHQPSQ